MKKFLVVIICLCTVAAFARGPHHGRHHHHRGHDGVWLAAGITTIVANGIGILNAVSSPRYVAPAPVVQTPVVVPQTVYPQVEYTQPQVVYPQSVGVPPYRYYEQRVPVVQTILVPIQVNGRIVYRHEQRVVYVTK